MTATRKYVTATAFRASLETRLKQIANTEQVDLQRLRRMVAFDRFLARIVQDKQTRWVLKGGYAMELRLQKARATKDIDLTIEDPKHLLYAGGALNEILREELQEQASRDLGDYFVFMIGVSMMDINAAPYGGARYPVDARLDGRTFVKFHLDIGVGDAVLEPLESIITRDWLGFAGLGSATVLILSKEQQFSEKLHAYTLPNRSIQNSRVKDLVDMALLIKQGGLDPQRIKASLDVTFMRRKTHSLPEILTPPPDQWKPVFEKLAKACGVTDDIEKTFTLLNEFMKKI
jgi:hypothetical protein